MARAILTIFLIIMGALLLMNGYYSNYYKKILNYKIYSPFKTLDTYTTSFLNNQTLAAGNSLTVEEIKSADQKYPDKSYSQPPSPTTDLWKPSERMSLFGSEYSYLHNPKEVCPGLSKVDQTPENLGRYFGKERYDPQTQGVPRVYSLIIGILTAPKDFSARSNFRKTWASTFSAHFKSLTTYDSSVVGSEPYSLNYFTTRVEDTNETIIVKFRSVFLLGLYKPKRKSHFSNGTEDKSIANEKLHIQDMIDAESNTYCDVVQANYFEDYRNLTYKTGTFMHWSGTFCSNVQLALKIDSDIFFRMDVLFTRINRLIQTSPPTAVKRGFENAPEVLPSTPDKQSLTKIIEDLQRLPPQSKAIYCHVAPNMLVERNRASKYYLSHEEYEPDRFPPFCMGQAYVFTPAIAIKLYQAHYDCFGKYHRNEDTFWMGIVPQCLHVNHTNIGDLYKYSWEDSDKPYAYTFTSSLNSLKKHFFKYVQ